MPAEAKLNCRVVEAAGNSIKDDIRTKLNGHMAGHQQKINRRKKLRVNRIERVWFEGCRVKIQANVTLKRKIRRNAHGYIVMSSLVTGLTPDSVCVAKAKVHKVRLSRTLRIGERIYRRVANRTIPGHVQCYPR
ncbi:MAG: hypothetical protein ACLFWF_01975 [Alphaproteobacteria bacterium]